MATLQGPHPGMKEELVLSKDPPARFLVGISWGEKKKPGFLESLMTLPAHIIDGFTRTPGRKDSVYDLDLDCHIFGDDGVLRAVVTAENDALIDESKKVYHSGDNTSGRGGPDDEQIYVETVGLPDDYRHFVFTVRSGGKYRLDEIPHGRVRLAESKTDTTVLDNEIAPAHGTKAYGYIFCDVFRENGAWKFMNLDYCVEKKSEWAELLHSVVKR